MTLTHDEVVEYSEQCTKEELSGWITPVNDHDIEEEKFDTHKKVELSLELPNMHLNSCMHINH